MIYGGFLKLGCPQIIQFNRISQYKPSILGYHHLWKPPYVYIYTYMIMVATPPSTLDLAILGSRPQGLGRVAPPRTWH